MSNTVPYIDGEGNLHYQQYFNAGGIMYLREALNPNNPEYIYNHLKSNGIIPENYGVYAFDYPEIRGLSKLELIELCISQQELIRAYEGSGLA